MATPQDDGGKKKRAEIKASVMATKLRYAAHAFVEWKRHPDDPNGNIVNAKLLRAARAYSRAHASMLAVRKEPKP